MRKNFKRPLAFMLVLLLSWSTFIPYSQTISAVTDETQTSTGNNTTSTDSGTTTTPPSVVVTPPATTTSNFVGKVVKHDRTPITYGYMQIQTKTEPINFYHVNLNTDGSFSYSLNAGNYIIRELKKTVSEQEAKDRFTTITTNISKVEVSVTELSKATADFYAKVTTDATVTVKVEAEFYKNTASKLKTNAYQLETLKKQLDYVAKYLDANAVAATKKKISDLKVAISTASKNLNDLHTQFNAKVKEQKAKEQLTSITNEISKVEANVLALSKATTDFYAKATTDASVTVKVEAEFYRNTSGSLLNNTKQLLDVKKQLDLFVKNYGQSADVTAAYSKFTTQNQAITAAVEALIKFHTNFKPITATTTNH